MLIGVPTETYPGETRVAVTPHVLGQITKQGHEVRVQRGAGVPSGHLDKEYEEKGATLVDDAATLYAECEMIARVRSGASDPDHADQEIAMLRKDQILLAMLDPMWDPAIMQKYAATGATLLSMEFMPRTTLAQSMDALSSMATVTGYKAVLAAADRLASFFPMFMTAAGTIAPAKVFVLGAGVAGLQAIATAKRLGAIVDGYDVRPVVKEQVESLGANFVELDLETEDAQDSGGYAKEQSEEFLLRQQAALADHMATQDVVITTALIPGRKAPILITDAMLAKMRTGTVIVDLAAEKGGNCSQTKVGETIDYNGITIIGPNNFAASLPKHASQMYAKNIANFVGHFTNEGQVELDSGDELVVGTKITQGGDVVHERVKEALNA